MVASLRTQEYERLRPTFTHYAIAKLVEDGVVRHVITQVTTLLSCFEMNVSAVAASFVGSSERVLSRPCRTPTGSTR